MQKIAIATVLMLLALVASGQGDLSPALKNQLEEIRAVVSEFRELDFAGATSQQFLTRGETAERLTRLEALTYPPKTLDSLYFFYRALDLAQPGLDLETIMRERYLSQLAGYYDVENSLIVIIVPDGWMPTKKLDALQQLTYAHEFGHALQDQRFDLYEFLERRRQSDNFDNALAMTALIEGDASLVASHYHERLLNEDPVATRRDIERALREAPALQLPPELPPIIDDEIAFAYLDGTIFVGTLYNALGWEGIADAMRQPRMLTTEQVLHPERLLAGDNAIALEMPDHSALIDEGWRLAYDNAVGEFYLRQHFETQFPREDARRLARGWGGDRLRIFTHGDDGNMIWVWYQIWDSPADAARFERGYRTFLGYRYGRRAEDGLCFVGADETHCLARINDLETRISMAPDRATALALLQLEA